MTGSKYFLSKLSVFVFLTSLSFGGHAGQGDVEDASEDTPKSSHKSGLNARSFKDASFKFENDPFKKVASETNEEYAFRLTLNDFLEAISPSVSKKDPPKLISAPKPLKSDADKVEEKLDEILELETTGNLPKAHRDLKMLIKKEDFVLTQDIALRENWPVIINHLNFKGLYTLMQVNHELYEWGKHSLERKLWQGLSRDLRDFLQKKWRKKSTSLRLSLKSKNEIPFLLNLLVIWPNPCKKIYLAYSENKFTKFQDYKVNYVWFYSREKKYLKIRNARDERYFQFICTYENRKIPIEERWITHYDLSIPQLTLNTIDYRINPSQQVVEIISEPIVIEYYVGIPFNNDKNF